MERFVLIRPHSCFSHIKDCHRFRCHCKDSLLICSCYHCIKFPLDAHLSCPSLCCVITQRKQINCRLSAPPSSLLTSSSLKKRIDSVNNKTNCRVTPKHFHTVAGERRVCLNYTLVWNCRFVGLNINKRKELPIIHVSSAKDAVCVTKWWRIETLQFFSTNFFPRNNRSYHNVSQ